MILIYSRNGSIVLSTFARDVWKMIKCNGYNIKEQFPVLISSQYPNFNFQDFLHSLQENENSLRQLLLTYGGLLFRGFPIHCAKDFSRVVESMRLGNFVNYIGGDSPRDKIEKNVYTSTEAPPAIHIPLHQELSFIKYSPRHIYFFCKTAPQHGGQTIIADARRIYKALNAKLKDKFIENGLTYISRYYGYSKIMEWVNKFQRSHKSWIEVFETKDKQDVEKKCLDNEFKWKWLQHDWIEIQQTRPAIMEHPLTKEIVWFNQAHLYDFNPKLLGWTRYMAAKLFYYRKSTLLHEIKFANGETIPRQDLYHILDILDQHTIYFPWHSGDVLVLDNILAMHGRAPFKGARRILTALTA